MTSPAWRIKSLRSSKPNSVDPTEHFSLDLSGPLQRVKPASHSGQDDRKPGTEAPLHDTPSTDPASGLREGEGRLGSRCLRSSPTRCPHTHDTLQGKCVPRPRSQLSSVRSTWVLGRPSPDGTLASQDETPRLARTTGPLRRSFVLACATLRVPSPLPCLKLFLLPSLTVSARTLY